MEINSILVVGLLHTQMSKAVKNIKGKSVSDVLLETRFIKVQYMNE